jgi:hypothetical protein
MPPEKSGYLMMMMKMMLKMMSYLKQDVGRWAEEWRPTRNCDYWDWKGGLGLYSHQ